MSDHFEELVTYIKRHLAQGIDEGQLRQVLLQHNWHAQIVDSAFVAAKSPALPTNYSPPNTTNQAIGPEPPSQQPETDQYVYASTSIGSPSVPQKYKVFRAIGDTFISIKNNPAGVLLAVIISYSLAGASFFVVSILADKLLYGEIGLLFASIPNLLTILFGSLVLYTIWYAFAYSFILTATSLAIDDGRKGQKSSIGTIIATSFARVKRVAAANILFVMASFWPIVLMILLPIILLTSGHTGRGSSSILLLPILMIVATIWAYISLIRFTLAPYVALFETDVPVVKSLGRSKHLLMKGGQWFLVKGVLLLLLFLVVMGVATQKNLAELTSSGSITINIIFIAMSFLADGVLVMLYNNRKLARGNS